MKSLFSINDILKKGNFMCKLDLKDAFFLYFSVHPLKEICGVYGQVRPQGCIFFVFLCPPTQRNMWCLRERESISVHLSLFWPDRSNKFNKLLKVLVAFLLRH